LNNEDKIKKLAEEGKIEFAEAFTIEEYDDIAEEFLKTVCDINFNECFISDDSALSDFAGCCIPEEYTPDRELPKEERFKKMYAVGRENMVKIIKEKYGIDVDPYDYLITVFEQIKQKNTPTLN
jgi:hypothetical protein